MKQSLWELKYGFIGKRAHLILFDCVFSGFCYRSHHWHELMSQTFPVLVINKIYKLDVKITLYLQRTWHLQNKLLTFFFFNWTREPMVQANGKAWCLIMLYDINKNKRFQLSIPPQCSPCCWKQVPSISHPWRVQRSYQSRESKGCMFSSSFLSMRFSTVGSTTDWDLFMDLGESSFSTSFTGML